MGFLRRGEKVLHSTAGGRLYSTHAPLRCRTLGRRVVERRIYRDRRQVSKCPRKQQKSNTVKWRMSKKGMRRWMGVRDHAIKDRFQTIGFRKGSPFRQAIAQRTRDGDCSIYLRVPAALGSRARRRHGAAYFLSSRSSRPPPSAVHAMPRKRKRKGGVGSDRGTEREVKNL